MKKIFLLTVISISICFLQALNAADSQKINLSLINNNNTDEIERLLQAGADPNDVETAMQIDTSNELAEDWLEEKIGPTHYANYILWQTGVRQQLWRTIILFENAIQRAEQ